MWRREVPIHNPRHENEELPPPTIALPFETYLNIRHEVDHIHNSSWVRPKKKLTMAIQNIQLDMAGADFRYQDGLKEFLHPKNIETLRREQFTAIMPLINEALPVIQKAEVTKAFAESRSDTTTKLDELKLWNTLQTIRIIDSYREIAQALREFFHTDEQSVQAQHPDLHIPEQHRDEAAPEGSSAGAERFSTEQHTTVNVSKILQIYEGHLFGSALRVVAFEHMIERTSLRANKKVIPIREIVGRKFLKMMNDDQQIGRLRKAYDDAVAKVMHDSLHIRAQNLRTAIPPVLLGMGPLGILATLVCGAAFRSEACRFEAAASRVTKSSSAFLGGVRH